MPLSFVQIEQDKTRTIQWSFAFLVLFYLASALLIVFVVKYLLIQMYLGENARPLGWSIPVFDWTTFGWTCGGAGLASFFHWNYSTHAIIDKVLGFMSGRVADGKIDDEKRFRNVVEEAGVATGGKYRIEPYIIPTSAMNAFALQDFDGRSVIGITDGLLKRLSREQLEAVVAHEAGHIASGDCLTTTVTSSIFKVFDNISELTAVMMRGYGSGRGRRDGRIFLLLLVVFLLAQLLRFIGNLGAMFISREREYRADALSVKLTRNPVALAEALHIISQRWKGGGSPGESMDAIFIQSPRQNAVEDGEGFFANLFTTHPPIEKRIGILLDMAHVDERALEAVGEKSDQRFEAARQEEMVPKPGEKQWMVRRNQQWLGPFNMKGMQALEGLMPNTVIRRVGGPDMLQARLDHDLWPYLPLRVERLDAKDTCPRCHIALEKEVYEGVDILRCQQCSGVLVGEQDVLDIVGRREIKFSPQVIAMAEIMLKQPPLLKRSPNDAIYDEKSILCPHCLDSSPRMTRRFVNPKYPVEIDKCRVCARVWFDRDELELLQFMFEKDHPLGVSPAQGNTTV
jgi:heat shock protein HtpX